MGASRIKGITVEIDGNTTKLTTALQNVNKTISSTQTALRDVDKLLKLDPSNTDLLKQKQEYLAQAIQATKDKLSQEKAALEQLKDADGTTETTEQQNALQREIIETTQKLEGLEKQAKQAASVLGTKMQEAGKKVSEAGAKISSVGSKVTAGVTVPVLAAGVASAKMASDYEENLNKVDASFKDSSAQVKVWAKTATEQFGLSESAALEATSLFGDMGTSMGLTTQEAAKMSTELAGLAGDLSSFKNIDLDQAMSALKGVFTGETESLKSLGVVMTETNLKGFAKELGLVYDEMSQTEKVTLRYKYVLANTKNAQGDYINTSKGAANSSRTFKSEVANLGAAFGTKLLPQVTPIIQKATELVKRFGEMDDSAQQTVIHLGLVAAAAGPTTTAIGKLTEGTGKLIEKGGNVVTMFKNWNGGLAGMAGPVGIAVAGLTAAGIGMGLFIDKVVDAHDPINRLKESIAGIGEAQETISGADNIISLCDRYDELSAKARDASLSDSELAAVEDEMKSIRDQLSAATDGAIDAQSDLNGKLDAAVTRERELAKVEKERANALLYAELIEGAEAYQDALSEQRKLQEELRQAEEHYAAASQNLTEGSAEAYERLGEVIEDTRDKMERGIIDTETMEGTEELSKILNDLAEQIYDLNGNEVHFDGLGDAESMVEELIDSMGGLGDANLTVAETTTEAADKVEQLRDDLEEQKAVTDQYTKSVVTMVRNGMDAQKGADLLGISLEGMRRQILAAEQEELNAAKATGELTDAQKEAITAAEAQAEAEQKAAEEFANMVTALEGMPEVLSATGSSATELASLLTEADMTVDEFSAGITSMRESAVNDFKLLSEGTELTAAEMVSVLQANLATQQEWSNNLSQLWSQAYAEENTAVMQYIQYLANMGPEYASVVAEFANGGYSQLQEAAAAWQGIGEQSASDYAAGVWMNSYLAGEAADGVNAEATGAMASPEKANESGQKTVEAYASGAESATPRAAEAGEEIGTAAVESAKAASGDARTAGEALGKAIADGITSQKTAAKTAGTSLGNETVSGINSKASSLRTSGKTAAAAYASGVTSGRSTVVSAVRALTSAAEAASSSGTGGFRSSGSSAAAALAAGISSGQGTVAYAAATLAGAAQNAANISGWYSVGYNMVAGIANGVRGGSYLISNAAASAARSALASAKSTLGIHSPSRVFRDEVGRMIPEGMALGIDDGAGCVSKAVNRLAETMTVTPNNSLFTGTGQAITNRTVNNSYTAPTVINVYGAQGQSVKELAREVEQELAHSISVRGMALT